MTKNATHFFWKWTEIERVHKRYGNRKQAVTIFRVTKPTGLTPGYEKKHRHAGVTHSERNHDKPEMCEG